VAKQRTRKQKENPHWPYAHVKRQKNIGLEAKNDEVGHRKSADISAQEAQARSIKHDLVRSLILISFILCLELVIYLAWK